MMKKCPTCVVRNKSIKLGVIFLIFILTSCSSRQDYAKQLQEITQKWDDAFKIANSTSRIALSEPVARLQAIKREAERIKVFGQLNNCHSHLLKYMDLTIEGFLSFMQHEESSGSPHWNEASEEFSKWQDCVPLSAPEISGIKRSDEKAKGILRALSTASEAFATGNRGYYPTKPDWLTKASSPLHQNLDYYMNENYCEKTVSGFTFTCNMRSNGYIFTATPVKPGISGSTVFSITTGGYLTPNSD